MDKRNTWTIAKTYWASEDKWSAWGLLPLLVLFNPGTVCTSVGINAWNRGFYNPLQTFDRRQTFAQLGVFPILGGIGIMLFSLCVLFATRAATTLEEVANLKICCYLAR
jgi:putative ATP-binding cassette transporter